MKTEVRKFIDKNKLTFEEGSRNSTMVTLIGFSQHLDWAKSDLETELEEEINEDPFLQDELDRLWGYCSTNNYKSYWSKPEAKKAWKF